MGFLNKKSKLWSIVLLLGMIGIVVGLLLDRVRGRYVYYGVYETSSIIMGIIFVVAGLILFIVKKDEIHKKNVLFSEQISLIEIMVAVVLVALSVFISGFFTGRYMYSKAVSSGTYEDEHSIGIYTASSREPFNFTGKGINNPVLTKHDVTDTEAYFVADPFLFFEKDVFYMFFEVYNAEKRHTNIAFATSKDGISWQYEQIILDEAFSLSYPLVFRWKDERYMLPSSAKTKSVRLYKAVDFPYKWTFVKTLLKGKEFSDNTIFEYNDMWWIFTETQGGGLLRLYYAEIPLGPWTEHPESPIIRGDKNIARPGGSVTVFDDRIVRYAQDGDPYYGNQVWAFEITRLTTEEYEEKRVGSEPVITRANVWNSRGMHQISPQKIADDKWIASVDGRR